MVTIYNTFIFPDRVSDAMEIMLLNINLKACHGLLISGCRSNKGVTTLQRAYNFMETMIILWAVWQQKQYNEMTINHDKPLIDLIFIQTHFTHS